MGIAQGWNGYVGFGTQTALTTAVTPSKYQHVSSGVSLKENQGEKAVVPGIIKGRQFVTTQRGSISVDGSIPMILRPDNYAGGRMWASILPSNSVTGDATNGYTHTFSEGTIAQLPSKGETIEVYKGGSDGNTLAKYIGMFLKKLSLNIPESGAVNLATDWIGVKETLGGTVQTPSYTTQPPFECWHLKLEIGANLGSLSEVCVKDLTFEYDTMAKMIYQKCSSNGRYASGVSYGIPVVNLSFNKVLEDDYATIYNYFKNNTENAVQITFTHDTALAGSDASSYYHIKIKLPRVTWLGETPALDSEEDLNLPMNLQALREFTSYNYTVQIEVLNSETGTYSV